MRKTKSSSNSAGNDPRQLSKNQIKFVTRQKRAEAKRSLNNLFNHIRNESPLQNHNRTFKFFQADPFDDAREIKRKKKKIKISKKDYKKSHQRNSKGKFGCDGYNYHHSGRVFHDSFGDKHYTWSFRESPKESGYQFDSEGHDSYRDTETHVSNSIGSFSERATLGLPAVGQLTIEEVKQAFRVSALKWHPDLHRGSGQAGEKFRECVEAYKSLTDALS